MTRMFWISRSTRIAHSTTRSPGAVTRDSARPCRSKMRNPSSSSSCRSCLLTAGCVVCSLAAAEVTFSSLWATVARNLSCCSFMCARGAQVPSARQQTVEHAAVGKVHLLHLLPATQILDGQHAQRREAISMLRRDFRIARPVEIARDDVLPHRGVEKLQVF